MNGQCWLKLGVWEKPKMTMCGQQKVGHQNNSKSIQHHGGKIFIVKSPNYKHGGIGEI